MPPQASQTHTRSRTGCRTCRIKKCDEVRPACGRCREREHVCTFDREVGTPVRNRPRRRRISGPDAVAKSQRGTPSQGGDSAWSVSDDHIPLRGLDSNGRTSMPAPTLTASASSYPLDSPSRADVSHPTDDQLGSRDTISDLLPSAFFLDCNDINVPDSILSLLDMLSYDTPSSSSSRPALLPYEPTEIQATFDQAEDHQAKLSTLLPPELLIILPQKYLSLLHFYFNVQVRVSVAIDTTINPLSRFVLPLISLQTEGNECMALDGSPELHAAFWALLACASTHHVNLLLACNKAAGEYQYQARATRALAYRLVSRDIDRYAALSATARMRTTAAVCLLLYTSCLDGNSLLLTPILERYHQVLRQRQDLWLDKTETFFLLMTSAYQTFLNFASLARGTEPLEIYWNLLPPDKRPLDDDFVSVFGMSINLCDQCGSTFSLVRGFHRAKRESDLPLELECMLAAEEQAESFENKIQEALKMQANGGITNTFEGRLVIGEILSYGFLRVLLLDDVFHCDAKDERIQSCVRHAVNCLPLIRWGTETGLMMPLLVLGSFASPQDRTIFQLFAERCCWKGSKGPEALRNGLRMVEDGCGWRQAIARLGYPILA